MYPYAFGSSLFPILLMVIFPFIIVAVFAWLAASFSQPPSEDSATRIARERFARGEISAEELGVLLHAL
jgi:uncharacterized membrane protein